jgi:hypothetical protein
MRQSYFGQPRQPLPLPQQNLITATQAGDAKPDAVSSLIRGCNTNSSNADS